jgi:hypothetical protein
MINNKLKKIGIAVEEFVKMIRNYNLLGENYVKKSEYFSDI